jgi:hypothetical protein
MRAFLNVFWVYKLLYWFYKVIYWVYNVRYCFYKVSLLGDWLLRI